MLIYNCQEENNKKENLKMREYVLTRANEAVFISDYEYTWYIDGELMGTGLIEDPKDWIKDLIEIGFEMAEG